MKIAIMGAMPEEIAPLLEKVGSYTSEEYAGNTYYQASYAGHDLVIAYSKIGKVFSTLTATTLLEKYACETLLFSGVAGAINSELKIGDLIVAEKLCQHDLDITAFGHPHGFVPEGAVFVETDKALNRIALEVANAQGKKVLSGTIATGDQFIHDKAKNEWIGETFGADALEMEGASVAVVCKALETPFFVLRAISDAADMDASFSFDEFLETAAVNSAEFVIAMVEKI
jgi:adenosylhomocysteine/aminodeoxyfutalosine nucleosidase